MKQQPEREWLIKPVRNIIRLGVVNEDITNVKDRKGLQLYYTMEQVVLFMFVYLAFIFVLPSKSCLAFLSEGLYSHYTFQWYESTWACVRVLNGGRINEDKITQSLFN